MKKFDENSSVLTSEKLLAASAEEYMNAEQLAFFQHLLKEQYTQTQAHIEETKQQLAKPQEFNDEADRASWEEETMISLRIVDRERKLLNKIEQSLQRIHNGNYGYCLESGEPIGIARLLARPTAEYCADVKELKEKKETFYNQ